MRERLPESEAGIMKHSDTISKIAVALVAAQRDMKTIAKDSQNPHYKSRYASLDGIVEAIRPVLAAHKLAVVQGACDPILDADGAVAGFTVETMLIHESGEWLSNAAVMPLTKNDAQGAGGAMTYGRRYGLSALLSLATDDDDDGHTASTPRATGGSTSASRSRSDPVAATPAASGVKVMPFGKTKGKPLGEHTTEDLERTVKWCREKDADKFKDLIASCTAILNDRALGVPPAYDETGFPTALRDEADALPF